MRQIHSPHHMSSRAMRVLARCSGQLMRTKSPGQCQPDTTTEHHGASPTLIERANGSNVHFPRDLWQRDEWTRRRCDEITQHFSFSDTRGFSISQLEYATTRLAASILAGIVAQSRNSDWSVRKNDEPIKSFLFRAWIRRRRPNVKSERNCLLAKHKTTHVLPNAKRKRVDQVREVEYLSPLHIHCKHRKIYKKQS